MLFIEIVEVDGFKVARLFDPHGRRQPSEHKLSGGRRLSEDKLFGRRRLSDTNSPDRRRPFVSCTRGGNSLKVSGEDRWLFVTLSRVERWLVVGLLLKNI